jgi:hypothetical protein
MAGVPRRERPPSAAVEVQRMLKTHAAQDAAAAAAAATAAAVARATGMSPAAAAAAAAAATSPRSPTPATHSAYSRPAGSRLQPSSMARASGPGARPASAPSSRPGGSAGPPATASPAHSQQPYIGGTLAGLLSPAVALQAPQITSDAPPGPHWRAFEATVTAGPPQPPGAVPAGSLFQLSSPRSPAAAGSGAEGERGAAEEEAWQGAAGTGSAGAWAQEAASRPPSARWAVPHRSAIEQAFLTRLERQSRLS